MPYGTLALSGYRGMWLCAMFDLPVDSKEARKEYVRLRNTLLDDGFTMLQFSVYARYCVSEEASVAHRSHVRKVIPSGGQVRLLSITDRQFGKMDIFYGKTRKKAEKKPTQAMLF